MTTAWFQLLFAGLLEVGWATMLKRTDGFDLRHRPVAFALTAAMFGASLALLALAVRTIPLGTGYAVWTGIGALGAVMLGMIVYHEPATWPRLACVALLIAGLVGLQLTTPAAHAATPATTPSSDMNTIYIGTYTRPNGSEGIYRATFDPATGAIGTPTLAAKTQSPSYLAFSSDHRFLYAIAEVNEFDGTNNGAVVAFAVSDDGSLRELNRQASGGAGPAYVSVTADGRFALVANYGGGTVAMLPIAADGSLKPASSVVVHEGHSVNPKRQDKPYAHSIRPDPTGRFAIACDLGTDEVTVYRIDAGTLAPASVAKLAPGSGPRHCTFSVDGKSAYVVNELANTVARFDWDAAAGTLTHRQTISTLPADFVGENTTAEIAVHPSGRFVFASNRGDDSIAVFPIDAATGALGTPRQFKTTAAQPRNFVIDPSGRFLLASNQRGNAIVAFAIDPTSGALTPTGSRVEMSLPCCVRFAR